ncbi:MAG TPA: hypothetical protein VF407_19190 [Polyangiaceae bacterium]
MQSAKKQSPKIDERSARTERTTILPRPRLESGFELTAHRSLEDHSIEDYVDPFVDPIAGHEIDPFDRALIESFAFDDDDDLVIDEADFLGDEEEDDTIRMERPTFGPKK